MWIVGDQRDCHQCRKKIKLTAEGSRMKKGICAAIRVITGGQRIATQQDTDGESSQNFSRKGSVGHVAQKQAG